MSQCSLCGGEILDRSDSRYCVYCNSTFHRGCIVDHFYRNKYCPVCNKKMSLIFMRYGGPPEPVIKKRPMPKEIRKPKWPHVERRREVPVFDIDIPQGPLKRTDRYIPKARDKKKTRLPKVPRKLVGVIVVLVVAAVGVYYGIGIAPFSLEVPGEEASPASPWTVVWTYTMEGVSDIAASEYGIVVGGRNGFAVLDFEGNVLWEEKEGDITDVDIEDVVTVSNRGTVVVYTIDGSELTRYGEGTADSISLSEIYILAVGLSDGGVVLLDTLDGTVVQEYPTGEVGAVSISSDSTVTAYMEGGKVYVLDVLGKVLYGVEVEGSSINRFTVLSSGWVFAHAGSGVFLYDGDAMVWSAQTHGCEDAGLSVSADETKFAVNADEAAVYGADGALLYTLPEGSCGGIAFSGEDIVVSDSGNVYFLRLEEVEEGEAEPEAPEAPEESEAPEAPEGELGDYEDWFTWYASFLSEPGSTAEYSVTVEEEGEVSLQMKVHHTIEGREGDSLIEIVTMTVRVGEYESKTSFKRWVNPKGVCIKAEMTVDDSVSPLECSKTNIRGIDLREILTYQWEYIGQEEITVGKGTFTCHKLQVDVNGKILTLWVATDQPPIKIILQEGTTVVTMELQ